MHDKEAGTPQHHEDRKVQKLVERIVQQQAFQASGAETHRRAHPPTARPS
jgi:hypothetical protein